MYEHFNALGYSDQQVEDIKYALESKIGSSVNIDDHNTQFKLRYKSVNRICRSVYLRLLKRRMGFKFLICTGNSVPNEKLKAQAYLDDNGAESWEIEREGIRVQARNEKGRCKDHGNVMSFCQEECSVSDVYNGRGALGEIASELLRLLDGIQYFTYDLSNYREAVATGEGRNARSPRHGLVGMFLDRSLCLQILQYFLNNDLPWIETSVGNRGRSNGRHNLVLRKVAGNMILLEFYNDHTVLSCGMNQSQFGNYLARVVEGLNERGITQITSNGHGIYVALQARVTNELGNLDEAVLAQLKEIYKQIIAELRDAGCYREKLDPQKRQIQVPADCREDMSWLKSSLVFAMSHGSHELFHTNVWAWLIQKNHEFAKVFFPNIRGTLVLVKREQGNRDLTIWANENGEEKAYVVENKFKSLPREGQLQEYQDGLNERFSEGLLVTLIRPDEQFNARGWRICTQEEICDGIENMCNDQQMVDTLAGDECIIREYIGMTRRLSRVLRSYMNALGDRWALALCRGRGDEEIDGDLEDIKLCDVFRKLNADGLVWRLENDRRIQQLREAVEGFEDGRLKLEVSHEFLHKCPVVNAEIVWHYDEEDASDKKMAIGVMLQWNSLARSMCSFDRDKYDTPREIYQEFKEGGMWFDDEHFLAPGLRNLTKPFKSYETDKYVVTYQDMGIERDDFDYLVEKILCQLELAWQMVCEGKLDKYFGFDNDNEDGGTDDNGDMS